MSAHHPASPHPPSPPEPPFVTTSLPLGAYIEEVHGLRAKLSRVPGTVRQVQFEFPAEAAALAEEYYSGGLIPAHLFAESIQSLKDRIVRVLR